MRPSDSGAEASEEDPVVAGRAQTRRQAAVASMNGIWGRERRGQKAQSFWSFGRIRSGEELELQLGVGRAYGRRSLWLHASQPSVSMDRDLPTVGACRYGAVETVPSDLCI